MKKRILMWFVGAGIAAQLAVPVWMIAREEWCLRNGARVYFNAAAFDPHDAFRGKYVDIRLAEFSRSFDLPYDGRGVYHAILKTNESGVARIARVTQELPDPEDRELYVTARQRHYQSLENPFNRFYMPEKLAPVAEEIYNESTRGRGATNSVVLLAVRLHNGRGVVEDLLVDGTPMAQAARERLKAGK